MIKKKKHGTAQIADGKAVSNKIIFQFKISFLYCIINKVNNFFQKIKLKNIT